MTRTITLPQRLLALCGLLAVVSGGLLMISPILWAVSTSLKLQSDTFTIPLQWIPPEPRWSNYPDAFRRFAFDRFILNSLVVALAVTASNLLCCSLAGYGLAKYRFLGREVVFLIMLSTLMLPLEVLLVPTYLVVKQIGWVNTYQGLIVPLLVDAFGIFLMRQFIRSIPNELIEAARIDGASEFGIYWRIVLPNIKPALAALAVFSFREAWDLFIWPLVAVTSNDMKTLPLGIAQFESELGVQYHLQMAIAIIGMIPLILLFLAAQRAFERGIVLSGIKE
ncbi:MAG: carbohydrate ABC transporter permease [Chloroflexi bacterium]|nr:carbohydrate ABC transporter permease [Chloroflexota bacterium]